ncbi:tRNA pseudouridine(13) synthase TruD [Candidatus Desantisbacteria bacterium]|nr:tRNA pseudouridine(13) synthase TruD [Candidatus Desantisbacteria bacterium]
MTIKSPDIVLLEKKKFSLKFYGFMEQPMTPNLIEGNKFKIILRDITEENIENIQKEIEIVNSIGYINYFDDQRFGSFEQKQGFLAEEVLKRHFGEVLKIYLVSSCDSDKKDFFLKHWNDWKTCRKKAATKFEKKTFDFLIKNPVYFLSMIKQIPKEGLTNHFSAYNGYIWNEVLRRILRVKALSGLKSYPGAIGDYIFYSQLKNEDFSWFKDLFIPTLPYKFKNEEVLVDKIYNEVMESRGIKYSMFNKVKTRQVFFKSVLRKAFVKPEGLNFSIQDDDIYNSRKKLILSFILPRGSYGTILIKRIFSSSK